MAPKANPVPAIAAELVQAIAAEVAADLGSELVPGPEPEPASQSSNLSSYRSFQAVPLHVSSCQYRYPPPPVVPFPPAASTSGKKYYLLVTAGHLRLSGLPPFIACGSELALQYLGGTWTKCGRAPKGFADLEQAAQVFFADTRLQTLTLRATFVSNTDVP